MWTMDEVHLELVALDAQPMVVQMLCETDVAQGMSIWRITPPLNSPFCQFAAALDPGECSENHLANSSERPRVET